MMPGKADYIRCKDEQGNVTEYQKRVLVMTISEVYACFKKDYPQLEIGKSKFAELRPKHVLLSSKMPHNVCGCKYHSNVILILEALHNKYPEIPLYSKSEFLSLCRCDVESEDCMSNNCLNCKDEQLFEENITRKVTDLSAPLSWLQWETDAEKYVSKVPRHKTTKDALDELSSQLTQFCWHVFIKDKQEKSYSATKERAMDPASSECLLQMDFAENFTSVWQDEIQAAHWRQRQITVYTVMIYHRGRSYSKVIVSDSLDHDKKSVAAFTFSVLDSIKDTMPNVSKINIWTDGPSSQYKNKYVFALSRVLSKQFKVGLTWNYFATAHGKGPNDALGGVVKRTVHRMVLTRQASVTDAASFADSLRSSWSSCDVTVIDNDQINETYRANKLENLWNEVPAIPGTSNTHCVEPVDKGILIKFYSSSTEGVHHAINNSNSQPSHDAKSSAKRKRSALRSKTQSNSCKSCGHTYGEANDPKREEEWLKCAGCESWYHETCAEDVGVIDDSDIFYCMECM